MHEIYGEKLDFLKNKGILTESDFEKIKQKLFFNLNNSKIKKTSLWKYFLSCVFEKYLYFEGRSNRKEFFGFFLFFILIKCLFVILFLLVFATSITKDTSLGKIFIEMIKNNSLNDTFIFIKNILNIILFFPLLSVCIRRLHDINKTGYWTIPLAGMFIFNIFNIKILFIKIILSIFIVVLFTFLFSSGNINKNQYGYASSDLSEKIKVLDLLKNIYDLKEKNIINQQEFEEKKEEILKNI